MSAAGTRHRGRRARRLPAWAACVALAASACVAAPGVPVQEAAGRAAPGDSEALRVGRAVERIRQAIADPAAPDGLDAVLALGLDSRHYPMVRGWLAQELAAAQSIRDARGDGTPAPVLARIEFLQRAIRSIDLE